MSTDRTADASRRSSWLYRLNQTPLRDLLRGELSGRLALTNVIASADLPEPLPGLLHHLLRRPRLSRLQTVFVAHELIGDFKCRLATGATPEQVATSIGDIGQARALVRRGLFPALVVPAPCRGVVARVADRARLWRAETTDVARDLAAHFRDGLDAGNSPEALTEAFGDERHAARLIRRAKRRNRPAAWKAFRVSVRAVGSVFALAILLYLGLTIRLHLGSPRLTHNYWDELNAPIAAIPEQDRAWPLYRRAVLTMKPWPRDATYFDANPGDESWEQLAAHAETNQEAIRLFRAAAAKPYFGAPFVPEGNPEIVEHLGVNLSAPSADADIWPEDNPPLWERYNSDKLITLRSGAELLRIDGQLAALDEDGERAASDVRAMLQLTEHTFQQSTMVADIVATELLTRATDSIELLLADRPQLLSEEMLIELSHHLAGVGGGGKLTIEFADERARFMDLVERLYTDDGHGNGHAVPGFLELTQLITGFGYLKRSIQENRNLLRPLAMPAWSAVIADRRTLLRKYDELMRLAEAEAALPLWERGESAADQALMETMRSPIERYRYPLMMFVPSLSGASNRAEIVTQRRDGALAALALELYRRDYGDWPAALTDLTPRYLPTVPLDRYDGKPLKYRLVDGRPILYSIGVDRDDDGGRVPEEGDWKAENWLSPSSVEALKASNSPYLPDGDWVLWPPVD